MLSARISHFTFFLQKILLLCACPSKCPYTCSAECQLPGLTVSAAAWMVASPRSSLPATPLHNSSDRGLSPRDPPLVLSDPLAATWSIVARSRLCCRCSSCRICPPEGSRFPAWVRAAGDALQLRLSQTLWMKNYWTSRFLANCPWRLHRRGFTGTLLWGAGGCWLGSFNPPPRPKPPPASAR